MKKIKKQLQYTLLALLTMASVAAASPVATPVSAACNPDVKVLGFPKWYRGTSGNPLTREVRGQCAIVIDNPNDLWVIALNFVEMLLVVAVYVAAGFIVWGGFKYIKSQGEPGKISESKMAIINAVIGLVIALASVAIVDFIQGNIRQS